MYRGSEAVQTNKMLNKTYSLNSINKKKRYDSYGKFEKKEN